MTTRLCIALTTLGVGICCLGPIAGQEPTPLRQSHLSTGGGIQLHRFTLEDASRDNRWIGLEARDARWALDGSGAYFRWNRHPTGGQDPEADPWFFVSRQGNSARDARPDEPIPDHPSWSADGRVAAWTAKGSLFVYERSLNQPGQVRVAAALGDRLGPALVSPDGSWVQFVMGEDLFTFDVRLGSLRRITRKYILPMMESRAGATWLQGQQLELFARVRDSVTKREATLRRQRIADGAPQLIPAAIGTHLENLQLSPNRQFVTFTARTPVSPTPTTTYLDYVAESGYAQALTAREKVGEPQDRLRLGVIRIDPSVPPEKLLINWLDLPEAGGRSTIPHGPTWSIEGDRAVVQLVSTDWHDLWIVEFDHPTGKSRVLAHDHDDAWLGGPPVLSEEGGATLLEWLTGGRIVFASERSGWSHLYLMDANGQIQPLTSGHWEVRAAELSRDRTTWLIGASRESPSDDQLYTMPAAGGELTRITEQPGRHIGALSPDGGRVAEIFGDAVSLPELFLRDRKAGALGTRVTVSGNDSYFTHRLIRPSIVSVIHQDGKPVWGALYRPEKPNAEHAAILHIHGGGYRQFTHHGWSVYGYGLHLGLLHYLVEQGYTVLDFDYRGGAGYGRDYRTDIYQSMGQKDVDGALPAIDYLVKEQGIDRTRIGVYGISYGGFFTLMALFRHPGVFAAGIANASVTDWAHYDHVWTSRVLGLPSQDSAAYRLSSPIYYTKGLADPLLIIHGIVDDNVHFQDAARLIQKLIEDGKRFDVMVYPTEPHVIQTESSRLDFVRRSVEFFDRHLRGKRD